MNIQINNNPFVSSCLMSFPVLAIYHECVLDMYNDTNEILD